MGILVKLVIYLTRIIGFNIEKCMDNTKAVSTSMKPPLLLLPIIYPASLAYRAPESWLTSWLLRQLCMPPCPMSR